MLQQLQRSIAIRRAVRQRTLDARERFDSFAEFCLTDEKNLPIHQAPIHMIWRLHVEWCWANGIHPAILAPFEHGKCQGRRALVQLSDGSSARLGELIGRSFRVLAFDERSYTYRTANARLFPNGERRLFRIELRSGRSIEVTKEHPLRIFGGWLEAGLLVEGDHVAVVRRMPELGRKKMRPGESALLGYLVGDGSCRRCPIVTNGDLTVVQDVERCAAALGFRTSRVEDGNCWNVRISNRPRRWIASHGLLDANSRTKRTPTAIFKAPNDDVAQYLAAYFACDGHVNRQRSGAVELYSVNRSLLVDVQSLLTRFGVTSRVRMKRGRYRGELHESFRLIVTGSENLERFRSAIRIPGEKGARLASLHLRASRSASCDTIPLDYRRMLKRAADWHSKNSGISLDQMSKRGTTRSVVMKAALAEGNAELLRECSENVLWDRIVRITELPPEETFGIEVDDLHTYVSGDVVTHNSAQIVVGRVAYEIGRDPNIRVKVVSNDDDSAMRRVQAISDLLTQSAAYSAVFPHIRPAQKRTSGSRYARTTWTKHELLVERESKSIDPTVHARGVLSTGIGGRADLIVFDDVVDQKNAIDNPANREKVIHNFDRVWMSRLTPTARCVYIGTPWHMQDLTHALLGRRAWCVLRQWIAEDMSCIHQEVYGAPPGYPIPLWKQVATNEARQMEIRR